MAKSDIKAGSAFVTLLLKDNKFISGLKRAGQRLASFAKTAAFAGAAIATAAAGGIAVGIRQYIAMGDQLDKMSQRTGVSVEALSELSHAAGQSGTDLAAVEAAIRRNQKGLLDARSGLSSAAEGYRNLGLSVDELAAKNPEEQFTAVVDALAGVTDQSLRAAMAQDVFGKSGTKLLPMVENMAALRQESRDMGLTMSTEAAQGAARLLDAFSIVSKQIKVFTFEIGAMAAPFVEVAMPAIQRFGAVAINAIRTAGDFIRSNVGTVTEFAANAWRAYYEFTAPIVVAYKDMIVNAFTAVWEITSTVWTAVDQIVGSVWSNITGTTVSAIDTMQGTLVGYYQTISFVAKEWRKIWEMASTSAQLSVVRFGNQIGYVFGTVVPGYLDWFGHHWHEVLTDAATLAGTVASNIWNNLSSLWDGIVSLFNGEGFTFEWTPLTEGFRSAITAMPAIAAREMGPVEAELQRQLDDLATEVIAKASEHREEFASKVAAYKAADPFAGLTATKAAGAAGEFERPDLTFTGKQMKKEVFGAFTASALLAGGGANGVEKQSLAEQRQLRRDMANHFRNLKRSLDGGIS